MSTPADLAAVLRARGSYLVQLYDLWESFWVCRALHVMAVLGLADILTDGPLPIVELATRTATRPESLYRVLRLLAAHGILTEPEPRHFGLTPLGDCLRSDVPGSARWTFIDDRLPLASAELLHSVHTGEAAFDRVYGESFWDYLARDTEAGEWFDEQMHAQGLLLQLPALFAYDDWGTLRTVVDVAGGTGFLLGTLLARQPHLNGILVDRPAVLDRAVPVLERLGVADRCRREAGDIFTGIPSGGDAYILSRVLHDWDDHRAATILRTVRAALAEEGRILLLEMVVPTDETRHRSKAQDVTMLTLFGGGRERTAEEFAHLLATAGFRLGRIIPTGGPTSIIEGMTA